MLRPAAVTQSVRVAQSRVPRTSATGFTQRIHLAQGAFPQKVRYVTRGLRPLRFRNMRRSMGAGAGARQRGQFCRNVQVTAHTQGNSRPVPGSRSRIPRLSASGSSHFSGAGRGCASGGWHIPAARVVAPWESGLIAGIGSSPCLARLAMCERPLAFLRPKRSRNRNVRAAAHTQGDFRPAAGSRSRIPRLGCERRLTPKAIERVD